MLDMDQEIASAAKFILTAVGVGIHPYYWEMKQDFYVPAVYFPTPEVETAGDSVDAYRMSFTWYVKMFATTDDEAHGMAFAAMVAIREARNYIPLYDKEGLAVGKKFRIRDPQIKSVERGVWQLMLRWDSPRPFPTDQNTKKTMVFHTYQNGGLLVPSFPHEEPASDEPADPGDSENEGTPFDNDSTT